MFVKPGPDPHNPGQLLIVRHLSTRRELPPEGEEVPDDMYWRRRLAHGDVVEAEPPAPAEAEAKPAEMNGPAAEDPDEVKPPETETKPESVEGASA